jgi:ankyrin repeat protein
VSPGSFLPFVIDFFFINFIYWRDELTGSVNSTHTHLASCSVSCHSLTMSSDKKLFSRFRSTQQRSSSGSATPSEHRSRTNNSLSNIDEDEPNSSRYQRTSAPSASSDDAADQEYLMMQYEYQKQQAAADRSRRKSKSGDAMKSPSSSMNNIRSESEEDATREERRSKSHHRSARSKSRPRHHRDEKIEEQQSKAATGDGGESLRDYWKRRAEENEGKAGTSTAADNTASRREGRERDLDKQLERHRARSKSRGRPVRDNPERKKNVDSIASAIGSHHHPKHNPRDEISPLHSALEKSDWNTLNSTLMALSKSNNNSDMAAQLSVPHPIEGGTALHVAAWKAPPALFVKMIRLLPRDAREISVLMGIRDGEGNTPLHLCCGNLEYRDGCDDYCLMALKEIVKVAPAKAWSMQNSEGDTPLHMLVTSHLCTSDMVMSGGNSSSTRLLASVSSASKLALEAVDLALFSGTEALTMQEKPTGATPLHVALANGAHACVIEALLEAAPSVAVLEDSRGMLPLHWAAAFGRTSSSVVKRLIEENPQALVHPSNDGDIPLHLVVANAQINGGETNRRSSTGGTDSDSSKVDKNRLKMVELLMQDAGRAASLRDGDTTSPILMTNREKLTPLHCCALFDAPPQISKLLMKHPDANEASSVTNSFGATPLHLAAAQPGVSQSIATVLAIGTPDAACVQDRLKRTPLHVAAQNTYATNLLIKTLAELNPEAAAVKTQRGHLPLHLAAQSQAKEPVIRALVKAYPAAAEARNKSNNTPLHDAAKYRASIGVVKLLLDAYPGALYVQNQYGNLPLHCATAYQAPSDVVQLLLQSWPEGASMQNRNQDAPLHYAAAYATSAAAVRPLINAAPAAVLSLNSSGQSPVDRAKANNAPADIIELLESAAEDYQKNAASDGWASFGQQG